MDNHHSQVSPDNASFAQPRPTGTASMHRTAREHLGLAALAAGRVGRGALARVRRSRLLRWRYRATATDELLLTPPDLRSPDASFFDEVVSGNFGLAGSVVALNGKSPFSVSAPSSGWARELDGFGWLRHLEAAQSAEANALARELMGEWMRLSRRKRPLAWEPEVVARRIISWLSHASLLLDGAGHRHYAAALTSLTNQVTHLSASWPTARDGYPRLLALIAIVMADLSICDHDRELERSQALLAKELERQILPDGGHLSRNPAVLIELLLDLLPLRQCFAVRGKHPSQQLMSSIAGMTAMLRHLRRGDGTIARFNGMGTTERDALATVLPYVDGHAETAARSGYVRLERGGVTVLIDAGAAPPVQVAGNACAGCLSFEMSTGLEPLLVNAGVPRLADAGVQAVARSTASHNTLCLGEQSSAKLLRDTRLERAIGASPLIHPERVTSELSELPDGGVEIRAVHDGYAEQFGLLHERTLALDAAGMRLEGCDRTKAAAGVVRFAWDLPLAIHFHLHPGAEARVGALPDSAELHLPSGEVWRLTAAGATISIEDGTRRAGATGAERSTQVVLRCQCCGSSEVRWAIERIKMGRPVDLRTRRNNRTTRRLGERLAETSAEFDHRRDDRHRMHG